MRFTVTIEAPEGANALQGLAALPEGWRVVEYKEAPKVPSLSDYLPTIGLGKPKDAFVVSPLKDAILQEDARRFKEMVERSRTICGAPSPISAFLNPTTAILKDGTLRSVCEVQHGPPELQEPNTSYYLDEKAWGVLGTHPAVPPDTIVGLNPDGTIAGVAKVTPEQAIKTAAAYNKHAMPPGKHCE